MMPLSATCRPTGDVLPDGREIYWQTDSGRYYAHDGRTWERLTVAQVEAVRRAMREG